jgi:DNA-binding MarR family transcriptional regulator
LPVAELARRLRETPSSMSKHVAILRRSGIISHGTGSRDYRIPEAYQVPGERAVDLGWALVRLEKVA